MDVRRLPQVGFEEAAGFVSAHQPNGDCHFGGRHLVTVRREPPVPKLAHISATSIVARPATGVLFLPHPPTQQVEDGLDRLSVATEQFVL